MFGVAESVESYETEFSIWGYGWGLYESLDVLRLLVSTSLEKESVQNYLQIGSVIIVTR